MSAFIERISSFLLSRKKYVLLTALLCILPASLQFYTLNMDTTIASLLPDSSGEASIGELLELNPGARLVFVELSSDSPEQMPVMELMAEELHAGLKPHLLSPPAQGIPEPDLLLALVPPLFDEETERLWQGKMTPEAIRAAVANLRNSMSGPGAFLPAKYLLSDPLNFLDILKRHLPTQGAEAVGFDQDIFFSAPYRRSEDGRSLLLLLRPKTGMNDTNAARDFMLALETELGRLQSAHPGVASLVAGGLRYTAENTITIERDLKLTVTLSLTLIALIYLFTVRSWGAVWLFLTPLAAVIFAGSATSFIWPATAGLALGFGAAVLGLAEDYAVLVHFALRKNPKRKPQALGLLARPMIFSALLCISSFSVLMFSSIPALRQMGFFSAISLLAGLALALFILPCCPGIDKPFIPGSNQDHVEGLADLKPRMAPTLIIWGLLIVLCALSLTGVPFEASFKNLGANSQRLHQDMTRIRSNWGAGQEPLVWASSGADMDEALKAAADLARLYRQEQPAARMFSLADLAPPSQAQRENIERFNSFSRRNAALAEQELREAGLASGFKENAFSPFIDWFKKEHQGNSFKLLEAAGLGEILWWLSAKRGSQWHVLSIAFSDGSAQLESSVKAKGNVLLSAEAVSRNLTQAFSHEKRLLPVAGLLCFLLLALCFRRPLLIMLSCLPPLFGVAAVLGWFHISGHSLSLPGVAALILVVGLGADYGIVMLHELSSNLSLGAYKSILVSGLTTLAGLGVLIFAKHPVLHQLGVVTFFGLSAEVLAVLFVVPSLCRKPAQGVS